MRLIEVIHQRLMAERYQHRTPYKEVLKSISFPVGCYVDTGVSPSQFSADTRLDAYFQMLNSGDYDWFGTAVPSSSNGSVIYNINNLGASTIPYIRWGTFSPNTISYESGHSASDLNFSDAIHKVSMKGTEIRVDDVKVGTFGTTPSFVATKHIMLNNGRATKASTKWQRFAISGLCDMIPVLDWNDRPCFYDRVNKEFIYHSGTGTPTYERWNKLDVDYLQSDGSQYIQLNSTFDVTDEIEVKSRLIDINTVQLPTARGCGIVPDGCPSEHMVG